MNFFIKNEHLNISWHLVKDYVDKNKTRYITKKYNGQEDVEKDLTLFDNVENTVKINISQDKLKESKIYLNNTSNFIWSEEIKKYSDTFNKNIKTKKHSVQIIESHNNENIIVDENNNLVIVVEPAKKIYKYEITTYSTNKYKVILRSRYFFDEFKNIEKTKKKWHIIRLNDSEIIVTFSGKEINKEISKETNDILLEDTSNNLKKGVFQINFVDTHVVNVWYYEKILAKRIELK